MDVVHVGTVAGSPQLRSCCEVVWRGVMRSISDMWHQYLSVHQ